MRRILIDNKEVDVKNCSYGFPWQHDATCYNFRSPNETVLVSEIEKLDDWEKIETLVIGCDLDDYEFIAKMVNLKQLYIYTGTNLRNIGFVKELNKLSHLHIEDSCIENLDDLKELIITQKKQFDAEKDLGKRLFMVIDAVCINSCNALDGNELLEPDAYITEVIVNHKNYT